MLHIGTKKLARIEWVRHRITDNPRDSVDCAGWGYAFIEVDDHCRSGPGWTLAGETHHEAVRFLEHAVVRHVRLGMAVRRVMADNAKTFLARARRMPAVN